MRPAVRPAARKRRIAVVAAILVPALLVLGLALFAVTVNAAIRVDAAAALDGTELSTVEAWVAAGVVLVVALTGTAILFVRRREAREREEGLRQVRVRDRALAASADGILITDAAPSGHTVQFINPAFTRLMGWTAEDLIGQPNPLAEVDPAVGEGAQEGAQEAQEGAGRP